jgi:hypothetical protein
MEELRIIRIVRNQNGYLVHEDSAEHGLFNLKRSWSFETLESLIVWMKENFAHLPAKETDKEWPWTNG